MSEIKLLPCPFCGGEAEIGVSAIWCTNEDCGAELYHPLLSREELIKQWNTRKPMGRIVERLEEKKQEYLEGFRTHKDNERYGVACGFGDSIKICKEEGGIE